jgi:hypothetical protein
MPLQITRNDTLRPVLSQVEYPFDANSSLNTEEYVIGTDAFIDAALYFKTPVELPVHISVIDGSYGGRREAQMILRDSAQDIVALTVLHYDNDKHRVYNPDGVDIGILVSELSGLRRLISQVHGRIARFDDSVATFVLDVTKAVKSPNPRYLTIGERSFHGDVRLVAGHKCRWAVDAVTGALQLDIVGDRPSSLAGQVALRSINSVQNPSIWITHTPECNLRVETNGDRVTFAQAGDRT